MNRATLVYIVMLVAGVGGLWLILGAGTRLRAPTDLSGVWGVGGEDPTDEPIVPARPGGAGLHAVTRLVGTCEPSDIIANRLDPWHGAWYHPYSFAQLEVLSAPRGAPDDLTKLTGVGPQLDKKLNDAGIFHYWQVAAMKPEDVARIDAEVKLHGRIERDGWIAQARTLLDAA